MNHRSFFRIAAVLLLVGTAVIATSTPEEASAAPGAFDRNMVLSNAVFDAVDTMNADQIQAFLDRYPNSCLRNHRAPVPRGYSDYGPAGRAADVIRAAATLWRVNPQVILVTLEKEQSLVTGGAGCPSWRYWSAMGYGCPDGGAQYAYPSLGITSTCVSNINWAGFSAQVNRGTWQLQFNRQRAEGNLNWNNSSSVMNYGFYTKGWRRARAGAELIYYDGWATISGQSIYMTNGATATLYTYTPHVSANLAFYNLFTNWFGSVITPSTPAPPPKPTAQMLAYVDGVHRLFMGRPATDGEKHLWGTYLAMGRHRSGFVNHVVASDGYARSLVTDAYHMVLRRAPDPGGLEAWTRLLMASGRDGTLLAGLAGSDEYFATRAGSDHQAFLEAIYQVFLGRGVDPTGLKTWGAKLDDGSLSRTGVVSNVLKSSEYARRAVGKSYALVLGRWPDPAGWDYWSGQYLRSQSVAGLNASLGASDESYQRLSS